VWLTQLRRGWPNLRAGVSFSAGGSIFHQSERLERPSITSSYHPEGWQTFFHEEYMRYAVDAPGLWGVFVGNMFDSGAAKVSVDALALSPASSPALSPADGGIDDRGLVTFDRKDRKDAFWLYKANWNPSEPFVRIAGSRLDGRTERRQTIHVYSNLPEVELFVGGRSQGRRSGEHGIFVWESIGMRPGINRIEARATGSAPDRATINISTTPATYSTPAATPSAPPATATTTQPAPTSVSVAGPVAGTNTVPATGSVSGSVANTAPVATDME
jgi:beta-galactosidase